MAKEWHEQRWRFALGTLVLSGILAGLLRAQVIPYSEAALLIYWGVGMVLAIFLAMGPVAAEKSDGTWTFLLAQPVSRADVLLAKWQVAVMQLAGILIVATVAGALAMWSRGFAGMTSLFEEVPREYQTHWWALAGWLIEHPVVWLFVMAGVSILTLSCCMTPLFFILTRARNEFAAALGGILLTIVLYLWLVVSVGLLTEFDQPTGSTVLKVLAIFPGGLNPMLPLYLGFAPHKHAWLPPVMAAHAILWIAVPVWLVRRMGRKPARK